MLPIEKLDRLLDAVDAPQDVLRSTAYLWYKLAVDFRPDVIIELGRGYGNSTAMLTEAANAIGARVKSFDLHEDWERQERVAALVEPSWFKPLHLVNGDLTKTDFSSHVGQRTFILWDAHGFEIAEAVLGRLL